MQDIYLKVLEETLELSDDNSITGAVYFDFGDKEFPEENWNDFVVVILNWWLEEIRNMTSDCDLKATLDFMDGPFSVVAINLGDDLCRIECIERKIKGEMLEYSTQCQISKFVDDVLYQSSQLLTLMAGFHELAGVILLTT